MALRDEGRLALDDRLDTYLPGTRHGAVTIRQMLAHASGLQREPVGRIWENLEAPDQERLLRELEDAERVLPPHFAFHYSNLAYALLGQIVERLEKRSWEETVTERILAPLEMRHTGLAPDEDAGALGYLVHPHAGTVTARAAVRPARHQRARRALEHRRRPGPLRQLRRRPGGRGAQPRHGRGDVPAADHDRRRRLGPRLRAGLRPAARRRAGPGRSRRRDAGLPRRPARPPGRPGRRRGVQQQLGRRRDRRARHAAGDGGARRRAGPRAAVDALAAAARPRRAPRQLVVRGRGARPGGARQPAVGPPARRRRTRGDPLRARGAPTGSGPSRAASAASCSRSSAATTARCARCTSRRMPSPARRRRSPTCRPHAERR